MYLYEVKIGENSSLASLMVYARAKDAVEAMIKVRDWMNQSKSLKGWSIESVQVKFGTFIA